MRLSQHSGVLAPIRFSQKASPRGCTALSLGCQRQRFTGRNRSYHVEVRRSSLAPNTKLIALAATIIMIEGDTARRDDAVDPGLHSTME